MQEIWKYIQGYEGIYQASNTGIIRSIDRRDSLGRPFPGRVLNLYKSYNGYYTVYLCKNGKAHKYRVNRIIAQTFIPNPLGYPMVNHKDEIKTNNNVSNLEWCTAAYNINYGSRNEKCSKTMAKQ